MSNQRIEKDLLGEKEIPKEAYYGIQTQHASKLPNYRLYTQQRTDKSHSNGQKSSSTGKYESRATR